MIRFDLLTIFPEIFDSYINETILARAQKAGLIKINSINIRDYAHDKHHTTDDSPYGGGAGMVMKVEPICEAVVKNSLYKTHIAKTGLKHAKSQHIILLSAKGEQFTQRKAEELKRYKQIIFICGRYEGVDERIAQYIADEELSIGPYVLSGGELPALIVVEAVARLIHGVLGSAESLKEESFALGSSPTPSRSLLKQATACEDMATAGTAFSRQIKDLETMREYPQYTRPEIFSPQRGINWRVPEVLLSGDHKKIEQWRREHAK